MPVCSLSHVQLFMTPQTVAARLLCSWDVPGKDAGVGCHFLLQEIFSTQGLNRLLHVLNCRQIFLALHHWGRPILYICIHIHTYVYAVLSHSGVFDPLKPHGQ